MIYKLLLIFVLGLIFGSFANLVLYRLRNGGAIIFGRSKCPKCNHKLGFLDLFPVLSWVFLRGKCRYCKEEVSSLYPLVEISLALLWTLTTYLFLINYGSNLTVLVAVLLMVFLMFLLSVYDILYMEVPDQLSLLALLGALLIAYLTSMSWQDSLLAAIFVYSFFYFQIFLPGLIHSLKSAKYLIIRDLLSSYILFPVWFLLRFFFTEERLDQFSLFQSSHEEEYQAWIGGGDLRIAFFMGVLLGTQSSISALMIAYFSGAIVGSFLLVFKKKERMIPFAPFLCLGTYIAYFYGSEIFSAYMNFISV